MTFIAKRAGHWGTALVAATLLAATLQVAAVAPASAAASYGAEAPRTAFHHHFYRGVPGQNRAGDAMTDISADAGAQEEAAMASCADRYRSYDPASSTYLGYDGDEHACP